MLNLLNLVDMKIKRSKDSGRIALLTKQEKYFLQGKKSLDSKNKWKLQNKLDKRFAALLNDLEIIRRSKVLDLWRATRYYRLIHPSQFELLAQIFGSAKEVHLGMIKYFIKNERTLKENKLHDIPQFEKILITHHYFWIDLSPHEQETPRIDKKSLKPEFVLRKLPYNIKKEFGRKLIEVYQKGVIPTSKERAKRISEMWDKKGNPISGNVEKIPLGIYQKMEPEKAKQYTLIMKKVSKLAKFCESKGFRLGQCQILW